MRAIPRQSLELAAIPYLCHMKQVQFDMIAKTLFGLEQVLENELKLLGATSVKQGVRNVRFRGDTGFLYKANQKALQVPQLIPH